MKKSTENIERKIRGEFLTLSLRIKNSKFSFIRVDFPFSDSYPSWYILKASIQLAKSEHSSEITDL